MPVSVRSRLDGSATYVDNEYKHTSSTHPNGFVYYLVAASLVVGNDTTNDWPS